MMHRLLLIAAGTIAIVAPIRALLIFEAASIRVDTSGGISVGPLDETHWLAARAGFAAEPAIRYHRQCRRDAAGAA
jgi:hypothetical protein